MHLHTGFENTTPSQRLAAAAHHARLQRFAKNSRPQEVLVRRDPLPDALPTEAELAAQRAEQEIKKVAAWVVRQKIIRKRYQPWFQIVSMASLGISVQAIQRACAKYYDVSVTDICSHRRTAVVVRPRQVAAYLSKKLTTRSLPDLGRKFGDRDHTTILHAVRKIANLIKTDADLAAAVASIEAAVLSASSGGGDR